MNILMLTSSYPKYAGETTAPFIESIAVGLVRRQHTVHVLAPFHPEVRRAPIESGVRLHFTGMLPTRHSMSMAMLHHCTPTLVCGARRWQRRRLLWRHHFRQQCASCGVRSLT
jgi:hypothetical protein